MLFPTFKTVLITALSAVLLASCGGSSGSNDKKEPTNDQNQINTALSSTPVAGKIGGNEFLFKGGYARQTNTTVGPKPEDKSWSIWLYSEPLKQPCDMFEKHGSLLIAFSDALQTVGRSEPYISLERNIDNPPVQVLAAKGVLQVDEVTESKVVGRINVSFDHQTYAAGRFEVAKCPPL